MTYEDALTYLELFANYERRPVPEEMRTVKLERMQRLCSRLGDPQRSFRCVVVAGTNGKGSIAALLYSMLRESTMRVGLYTSPHLESVRERVRVWTAGPSDGGRAYGEDWISEEDFAALLVRLHPVLEECRTANDPPTFFEIVTAMAFLHFRQQQVEVAVLEVGLGGRLDATNVVTQAVSVFGPIDLDHEPILGDDPVRIAREKSGIIKPHQTVISVPQTEAVDEVLRVVCDAQGVPLLACGRDITVRIASHTLDGLQVTIAGTRGVYESLDIPLLGRHQADNAAAAVAALEALSGTGIPYSLVERGLAAAAWPGRLEIVHDAPLVIMDGAHNPHAAGALRAAAEELCPGRRIHLLVGMSSDKAISQTAQRLGGLAVSATCSQGGHPRAVDPTILAKQFAPHCFDVHVMSDARDAYTYLFNAVDPSDVIIVTGSLFFVGELRAVLRRASGTAARMATRV